MSSNHQALYITTHAVAVPKSFSTKVATAMAVANNNNNVNANFEDDKKRYNIFKRKGSLKKHLLKLSKRRC
jgi:hypothetical protein